MHPFIYTPKSALKVSVLQTHLTWSHCHSHSGREYLSWCLRILATKYESPWCVWCSRSHFLRQISLPLPNYMGCIQLNSGAKKICIWAQKTGVYLRSWQKIYNVKISCTILLELHLIIIYCSTCPTDDIQSIFCEFIHTTATSLCICSRFSHNGHNPASCVLLNYSLTPKLRNLSHKMILNVY